MDFRQDCRKSGIENTCTGLEIQLFSGEHGGFLLNRRLLANGSRQMAVRQKDFL
jgi:hypothetical protein